MRGAAEQDAVLTLDWAATGKVKMSGQLQMGR